MMVEYKQKRRQRLWSVCQQHYSPRFWFWFTQYSLKVPSGSTTELSHRGQQFLTHLFERFAKDRDHALSPTEFEELFSTCPTPAWGPDVSAMVPTNEKGWITYQGYMCQWALMTLTDLPRTFEYLAYLGYNIYENESQTTAVQGKTPFVT